MNPNSEAIATLDSERRASDAEMQVARWRPPDRAVQIYHNPPGRETGR